MTKSRDEENVCASAQVTRRPLLTIIKKAGLKYFQFDLISELGHRRVSRYNVSLYPLVNFCAAVTSDLSSAGSCGSE